MSDKKKKKSKQKQNQNQRQTQQVIVNVDTRVRRRRAAEPRREVRENKLNNISAQPPPIVQYVYRDNLALNAINERMRENAITQTLMRTTQQQAAQQQAISQAQQNRQPNLATPSPALYQQQQTPVVNTPKPGQPNTPPPNPISSIMNILENSKLFNQTSIPETNTNKNKVSEFENLLKPRFLPSSEQENAKKSDAATPSKNNPFKATEYGMLPFKLTKDGLPDKRRKDYNEIMEQYIGGLSPEKRTIKQQKAYESYLDTLTKPSATEETEPQQTPAAPATPATPAAPTQPDINDEEEEFIMFPSKDIKMKPT